MNYFICFIDCKKYQLVGIGKKCLTNVYTAIFGKCDGWAYTSLEECKRKCDRNEAPPGCQSRECRYVVWDYNRDWLPGWCQLATVGCKIGPANSGHLVFYLSNSCYDSLGSGKQCLTNVYTRIHGKCDGWAKTNLEDCKRKCDNDEAPSGCPSRPCKYVIWDYNCDWSPGWCQLATDGCVIGGANPGLQLHKKRIHGCSF